MSAFIVSKKHIDTLVSSAGATAYLYNGEERLSFHSDRDRIGQELTNQNYRSVNERYGESEGPPVYRFQMQYPVQPVQVIKACDCYRYQACETEDWQETLAYRILQAIREKAIRSLPGYEDAPWEITD